MQLFRIRDTKTEEASYFALNSVVMAIRHCEQIMKSEAGMIKDYPEDFVLEMMECVPVDAEGILEDGEYLPIGCMVEYLPKTKNELLSRLDSVTDQFDPNIKK
ncbi:hypothetical protein [Peromfec virus RodF7_16]|uniref:Uncharacterized protein n=1 Tax=Peromfec virus RodF7_16 TaxID=2929351 RepID=A0A976N214_9VIRU|nr:hypothetical protein [Peromfec virus RodF7_16]